MSSQFHKPKQLGQDGLPELQGKWFVSEQNSLRYLRRNGELIQGAMDYDYNNKIILENSGYFDTEDEALLAIEKYQNKE